MPRTYPARVHFAANACADFPRRQQKELIMKRDDIFPSKYLKAADLKGRPHVVQIKHAPIETLKNPKGEEQRKVVLQFNGVKKSLPLNLTNYDSVADIVGDDETNNWPGARIELYPGTTMLGGKTVDCIRIRKPREEPPIAAPPSSPPPDELADELDDSIPW
jgi:hypothetical protein